MPGFNVNGKNYNSWEEFYNDQFNKSYYNSYNKLQRDVAWRNPNTGTYMPAVGTKQNVPYIQTRPIGSSTVDATKKGWDLLSPNTFKLKGDPNNDYLAYSNSYNNLTYKKIKKNPDGTWQLPWLQDNAKPNAKFTFGQYAAASTPTTKPVADPAQQAIKETEQNIKGSGVISGDPSAYQKDAENQNFTQQGQQTQPYITPTYNGEYLNDKWNEYQPIQPGNGDNPPKDLKEQKLQKPFELDWNHLYDIAGVGLNIGNAYRNLKLANEAEKPLLHDPVEHHHAVYGDYAAKMQGQQNAGALLNTASKPITSDLAQTHATQLQSQIAANDAINQANAIDNAKRAQTAEIAWQQEKENKENRHAVAMSNRDNIAQSARNKLLNQQQFNTAVTGYVDNLRKVWQADYQKFQDKHRTYQDLYEQEFADAQGLQNYLQSNQYLPQHLKQQLLNYQYAPYAFQAWYQTASPEDQQGFMNALLEAKQLAKVGYYYNKGVNLYPVHQKYQDSLDKQRNNIISSREGGILLAKKGTALQQEIIKKRVKDEDRFAKIIQKDNERIHKAIARHQKVKKYQDGRGLVLTEFTPIRTSSEQITPPLWLTQNSDSKKKDSTEKGNSALKELLKQTSALDVDRAVINQKMDALTRSASYLDSSTIEARALAIQSDIAKAKDHKDAYNKAYEELRKIDAIGEPYIDSTGLVMVQTPEGNYQKVSVDQVEGNRVVTYAEAFKTRNSDASAAFDFNIINDLQSGIGTKSILDKMKEITTNLKDNDVVRHAIGRIDNGTVSYESDSILSNLFKMMQANNMTLGDGLYKLKQHDKNNYKQLEQAFYSIFQNLTTQEKALVRLKALSFGESPEQYMMHLLQPKASREYDLTPEITQIADHEKTSRESTQSQKEMTVPPMLSDILGFTGVMKNVIVQTGSGEKSAWSVPMREGVLTQDNKKLNTDIPLSGSQLKDKTDIASYGNVDRAVFGGKPIEDWDKVLLENKYFYKATLPVDSSGNPNFALQDQMSQLIKLLNENGVLTKNNEKVIPEHFNNLNKNFSEENLAQIRMLCDQIEGLSYEDVNRVATFIGCSAIAGEKAFKQTSTFWNGSFDTPDPNFVEEIDDSEENKYEAVLNNINRANHKDSKEKFDEKDLGKLYRGFIWMPIREDVAGSDNTQYAESVLIKGTTVRQHNQKDFKPVKNTINQ